MRKRLPLVDVASAVAPIAQELEAAAIRVLRAGRFVLGPEVAAFEREAAAWLGAAHAVGVSSGTDALFLALRALGVGPGDDVLVPVFGFVATAEAVVRAGATPIFVDVGPACGSVDLAQAERRLTPRTRALVHAPLGGHGAGTAERARWCRERGLLFVEDAAQSFGARDEGMAIGAFGDAAAFSFFPAKILGGFGDGGLVVTGRADVAERVRALRQHGRNADGTFAEEGTNARLDELQAALLRVRLRALDAELEARRAIARAYDDALVARGLAAPFACGGDCTGSPPVGDLPSTRAADDFRVAPLLLPPRCTSASAFGLYTVRLRRPEDRGPVRAALDRAGIDTAVYYARLLVEEPCFARFGGAREEFPNAASLAERTLTLPLYPGLGAEDRARVVEALAASAVAERPAAIS
jgi:dTDP-4-amino-4,6-dideoxygalactose transaminase